jgi:hypothetical protein
MTPTFKPAPVRKSVRVAAPAERAFEILTARIGRWWPRTHYIGACDLDTLVIEPREGGRWFERGIDGLECEIGKVLIWDPPSRLMRNWPTLPLIRRSAPKWRCSSLQRAMRVELEHRDLERLGDRAEAFRQQIDSPGGWEGLLPLFSQTASQTEPIL